MCCSHQYVRSTDWISQWFRAVINFAWVSKYSTAQRKGYSVLNSMQQVIINMQHMLFSGNRLFYKEPISSYNLGTATNKIAQTQGLPQWSNLSEWSFSPNVITNRRSYFHFKCLCRQMRGTVLSLSAIKIYI